MAPNGLRFGRQVRMDVDEPSIYEQPPSTLAAQIVDNLREPSSHKDQARLLKELLAEILDAERRGTVEIDVTINRELIYVLSNACLLNLNTISPFDNKLEIYERARNTLTIIDLTIRRSPELLFSVPASDVGVKLNVPRGPLFLWLIPILINLLDYEDDGLQTASTNALCTALSVRQRQPSPKIKSKPVEKYVQGCVKDLLLYLEANAEAQGITRIPNIYPIPTEETIAEAYSGDVQASRDISRVRHENRPHVLYIVVKLLSLLITAGSVESSPAIKRASRLDRAWIIDCSSKLWSLLVASKHSSIAQASVTTIQLLTLDILRFCVSSSSLLSHELVSTSRTVIVLCNAVCHILRQPVDHVDSYLEKSLCWVLVDLLATSQQSPLLSQICQESLEEQLRQVVESREHLLQYSDDFQRVLVLAFNTVTNSWSTSPPQLLAFNDPALGEAIKGFFLEPNRQLQTTLPLGPRKKVPLCDSPQVSPNENAREMLNHRIYGLLNLQGSPQQDSVENIPMNTFSCLTTDQQSSLFAAMGEAVCFESRTSNSKAKCHSCDEQVAENGSKVLMDQVLCNEIYSTMANLLRGQSNQATSRAVVTAPRPRVMAMLTLKRLLNHTVKAEHLDLKSPLGQWCCHSLKSKLRDLRIAAGRTIIRYVQVDEVGRPLRQNRIMALDQLRALSQSEDASMQETCILAFGQIASAISSEDETNIVLLRLVEFLGHTNPLISGLAYDELLRLSAHSPFRAMRLFEPFWRTIGVTVVKDLQSRPQIAHRLCDLLNIQLPDLLNITQIYTVPFLVLTKKRDILQMIADASSTKQGGQPEKRLTIVDICMNREHLPAILSCLLLQPTSDLEALVVSLFGQASPELAGVNFAEVMKAYPMRIAFELLRAAGEGDSDQTDRAHQAIILLADVAHQRHSGSAKRVAGKVDTLGLFFETHALAIIQLLSYTMSEVMGPQTLFEQKRCLGAVREMVRLGKSHIANALPQICACLRSAIETKELCNDAFLAWTILLSELDVEDLESLIDPTFAMIARHWSILSSSIQRKVHDAISLLIKKHGQLIRDKVNTIPSLGSIEMLSKFEADIGKLKAQMDPRHQFQAFSQRCHNENSTVVAQALHELEVYLQSNQSFLQTSSLTEQPDPVIAQLIRALLDACVRFKDWNAEIAIACAKCLGLVGCLDPMRIEIVRDNRGILVLSDFLKEDETVDFVIFFLREVLVKAFLAATNTRAQNFLGFAMQGLLGFCNFDLSSTVRGMEEHASYRKWISIPESIRNVLTPFLTSRYTLREGAAPPEPSYPIHNLHKSHSDWLRELVYSLLRKAQGENAVTIFQICRRIVRGQDIAISSFLLPFAALNVIVGDFEKAREEVASELFAVLSQPLPTTSQAARENLILCSQNVFQALDYFSRWAHGKRREKNNARAAGGERLKDDLQLSRLETALQMIPAAAMSRRAIECKNFARGLFYWERHIRQCKANNQCNGDKVNLEPLYEQLQDIYTQIDEPDGIEGISSHLQVLNVDQQVLEHRKAGRWTAVQSWYELQLAEKPDDIEIQLSLLTSLKESGQHDVLLNQVASLQQQQARQPLLRPYAIEASWITGKWDQLEHYVKQATADDRGSFTVGLGSAFLALRKKDYEGFDQAITRLRYETSKSLSTASTASLQACRDAMLRFHVLTEVEVISGSQILIENPSATLVGTLSQRLDALGAFSADKQYVLGIRRAAMQLSRSDFSPLELSSAWLTSATLARKGNFIHQAFNAVLHASQLGDHSATIEHARLLWKEGHHRKAIQNLEGAIAANAFRYEASSDVTDSTVRTTQNTQQRQNLLAARAHLLLAKWVDRAGQTQSQTIVKQYNIATNLYSRWEKGHYYLGKHYNKLLESEKAKEPVKQAQTFINGEMAKLVIENYFRSMAYGAKYIYQTLPRVLTLWLEFGTLVDQPLDSKYGRDGEFWSHIIKQRRQLFDAVASQSKKYIDRLPAFVFYTAFAQICARICHSNQRVYAGLVDIIVKVITSHPQQALWPLLAMMKSTSKDRSQRANLCMSKIQEHAKRLKTEAAGTEMRTLIIQGQKLTEQLLQVSNYDLKGFSKKQCVASIRDLGFSHSKATPCRLVVPLESTLSASLPTITDNVNMKTHKAFSKDAITISAFLDEVLLLNSLIRPRKVDVRGSDGRVYGLLCKPKDDLRLDQRLLEFNAMIKRSLKKDADCSKRRLYVKTYAVTPLNEECGLIEWVDGLKTHRDVISKLYEQKLIYPNYKHIAELLEQACKGDISKFTDDVLAKFPLVLYEWFVEAFPEPEAWFTARLRYTRSCAVMSMVGHALGLGDRHSENILIEEGNGGIIHVDFNCLFDKGLTFEKPERVPFRLTQNMVDAFGAYGPEGPFRKACELTVGILRQYEDTLMTILEAFLYDPTTDLIGKKKRSKAGVPDTPEGVLESVRNKVRGLLPTESVPLSVEGHVQVLIQQARDPQRLASMYIGWCAFL